MVCAFNRLPWSNSSADLRITNGKHVKTIFSTSPVHPRDRFDYWHSLACKEIVGHDSLPENRIVGNHVLDLIGLSIARTTGSATVGVSNLKAFLLGQIRSVVEARLADRDIDGQKVADIVGISVRYANAILAEQDSSLHRLILSRRLSRCRAGLEDPNQRQRTIAEIAQGWGFSDMTHFGRCFRAAFGVSPREYRNAAAQPQRTLKRPLAIS